MDKPTLSEHIADRITSVVGSLPFVIIQSILIVLWVVLNTTGWFYWKWDIYPFILMNLFLSLQAAYTGPFVLISQNRQAVRDRETNENDLQVDMEAKEAIEMLHKQLDRIEQLILKVCE